MYILLMGDVRNDPIFENSCYIYAIFVAVWVCIFGHTFQKTHTITMNLHMQVSIIFSLKKEHYASHYNIDKCIPFSKK